MSEPIRFGDLLEKAEFLDEASRQYPKVDVRREQTWACGPEGVSFERDDLLIAAGEPRCPHCDATGWHDVRPFGAFASDP